MSESHMVVRERGRESNSLKNRVNITKNVMYFADGKNINNMNNIRTIRDRKNYL